MALAGVLYVQTNIHACGTVHACIGFLLRLCGFSCVCTHRSQYRQEIENLKEKFIYRLLKDVDRFFFPTEFIKIKGQAQPRNITIKAHASGPTSINKKTGLNFKPHTAQTYGNPSFPSMPP